MPVKKLPYKNIAGVVPCPGGWMVLPGRLHTVTVLVEEPFVLAELGEVLDWRPLFDAVALHAPIGFFEEPGTPFRPCDQEARQILGWPRRSAIPPVPSRAALRADTPEKAQQIEPWLTKDDLRRFRWLRQVDTEMAPYHQRKVFSCHPELSYYMLNTEVPLTTSPFTAEGITERIALVRNRLPGIDDIITGHPPKGAATHHLVQAAALLWSARRIAGRVVNRLPLDPGWDESGLRMELVR